MSRPPDHLRTEPHHMPPDPCLLCGRGKRPGTRCCVAQLKWIKFDYAESSYRITERQKWASALAAILNPHPADAQTAGRVV